MATASPQASIEEMVTCPICMERMKEPKHLCCQHAFCAQCLQDWTRQPGNPEDVIVCPACRVRTPVHEGIGKLPTDINVTRLLDVLEGQLQKESMLKGFVCGVDGAAPVVVFCESCGFHLCGGCMDNHLHDQTLWPHLLNIDAIGCTQHSSKVQNKYCHDCETFGCHECMQKQHHNHDTADLAEVAKSNIAIMSCSTQSLQEILNNAQEQPDMVSADALERRFEELKQQIESHTKKGHIMLDVWNKAILADLKLKVETVGGEVSDLEEQLSKGASLVSFMDRFLQEGSDFQLVTAFSATAQRLHKTTDSLNHVARRHSYEDYGLAFVGQPLPESYGSLMGPNDSMSCTQREGCEKDESSQAQTHTLTVTRTPAVAKSNLTSVSKTTAAAKSAYSLLSHTPSAAKSVLTPVSKTPAAAKWVLTSALKMPAAAVSGVLTYASKTPSAAQSVLSSSSEMSHSGEIAPSPTISGRTQSQSETLGYTPAQRELNSRSMAFDVSAWGMNGIVDSLDLHDNTSRYTGGSHKAKGIYQWLQGTKDEDLEAPVTVHVCNETGYLYVGESGWWSKGLLWRIKRCTRLRGERTRVMTNVSTTSVAVSPVDGTIAACVGDHIAVHKFGTIPGETKKGSISHCVHNHTVICKPFGIAISDKYWVVVDKRNCVVMICKYFDGQTGHILNIGSRGSGRSQFCDPSDVCCDSVRERFIVSDTGNNRIQVFDMSGNYLWEAGQSVGWEQTLRKPCGLCLDGPGNIIVADSGNHRLVVLGWEKGTYLKEITMDIIPHSVTVDGRDCADCQVAYLVVAGLRGKMPVVQTRRFTSHIIYQGWHHNCIDYD